MRRLRSRVGFAHPAWLALAVVLVVGAGAVPAMANGGYLGVQLQKADDLLLEAFDLDGSEGGILVTEIVDDSPAEQAGLRRGDLILRLQGKDVDDVEGFTRSVRALDPGDEIELAYLRKGKRETVKVKLGEREERLATRGNGRSFWVDRLDDDGAADLRIFHRGGHLGVRVEAVDKELGRYFKTDTGLLVLDVIEDSGAEKAGIQVGDVIVQAGKDEIAELDDVFDAMEDLEEGDTIEVVVVRDGKKETVQVEVQDTEPTFLSRNLQGFPRAFGNRGNHQGMEFFFRPDGQRAPRVRTELRGMDREELREEMDKLQDEMQKLRKELEEMRGDG